MEQLTQLQHDNETLQQRNTELNQRIQQLQKENITIRNTIQDMMNNERTHIGYNTLKQLWEAIQ